MKIYNNPSVISFWWSAGYVYEVSFVGWVITKNRTGGVDTNRLGVGVLVESDWLFSKLIIPKIPYGCKRGQYILRPYTKIYKTYDDAWNHRNELIRPTLEQLRFSGT